ncbi:YfiR family protein [Dickeya lacustris]|uniref:YfiR family protein n=1 Tax=Dickeya lacustris TaxID=2259638 RepID=A0ABY8G584_9GAMM|nr:YfiR family protein [Dickeya lacustris]WFN55121.1 YfiR family protein [Dickeya lacustris]
MVVKKMLFAVMILASLLMDAGAQAQSTHPEWALISDADVRRTVSGIISYSHWPELDRLPVLCVFSSAHFLSALTTPAGVQEKVVFNTLVIKDTQELFASECDAVYFGEESAAEQNNAASYAVGHPLMTIAEQSPRCLEGSAFCLVFDNHTVGFAINMEALSRTGVRVNPDVLMLARERY